MCSTPQSGKNGRYDLLRLLRAAVALKRSGAISAILSLSGVKQTRYAHWKFFRLCEGFRMPAAMDGSACTGGRRPKASRGGNRDEGTCGGATRTMGI